MNKSFFFVFLATSVKLILAFITTRSYVETLRWQILNNMPLFSTLKVLV